MAFQIGSNVLDDTILGTAAADQQYGLGGNDTIKGAAGDDVQYGGEGNDDLQGKLNDDILYGGNGNDDLAGGKDDDILFGGKGKDFLSGGADNDVLWGSSDKDTFYFAHKGGQHKDKILDYNEKDNIGLEDDVFNKAKFDNKGVLKKNYFEAGKSADDGKDRIIYDEKSGKIYYDKNGDKNGGEKPFARVDEGTDLSHKDFEVYDLI